MGDPTYIIYTLSRNGDLYRYLYKHPHVEIFEDLKNPFYKDSGIKFEHEQIIHIEESPYIRYISHQPREEG